TLYYDKSDSLYTDIADLLKEYRNVNSRITLATVDYYRDPGAAEELKKQYELGTYTNKNFVIFDCAGRKKIVDGNSLAQYQLEPVNSSSEGVQREFRRKTVSFNGEMMFSAALLEVINPRPQQAFFLQGDGEHRLDDDSDTGYEKFAAVLQTNNIEVAP